MKSDMSSPNPRIREQSVRISDFSDVSNGSDWSADILVLNEGEEKTQRAKGAGAQRIQTASSPLRLLWLENCYPQMTQINADEEQGC